MSSITVYPWNRRLLKPATEERTIVVADIVRAEPGKVFDGTEHKDGTYFTLKSGEQIITNDHEDLKKTGPINVAAPKTARPIGGPKVSTPTTPPPHTTPNPRQPPADNKPTFPGPNR